MQVTTNQFDDFAAGPIRPLSWRLGISFDKTLNEDITFFTLDQSVLDGDDILAYDADNPIQQFDLYTYGNYTDRVQMVEWTREMEFPSSVTSAMADFTLENHDNYFSPNSGSPIDAYIIPKRPIRILSGFNNENIPQFFGVTERMPVIDRASKTASFHALDILSLMFTMPINQTIAMQDVYTGEVLEALFEQFGLLTTQYDIPRGSNQIPFLFFEKGTEAGEVFRKLMEAELGNLWFDETGVIRFLPRSVAGEAATYDFDESNVVDIRTQSDDDIINRVVIRSDVRAVQPYQTIYSKTDTTADLLVIPANGTRQFEADLQDPAISAVEPTLGFSSAVSWFTVALPDGTPVTSNVSITASELRTNSFVMTFSNTNSFDVNIDSMEIWGEPAKVVEHIEYTRIDQDSIDKFDERTLEIENSFIQSLSQSEDLAFIILNDFKDQSSRIEMEVKGHPGIQMGDVITVDIDSYDGTYKVIKVTNKLQSGKYTQLLTARRHVIRDYFILDVSLLDSAAVLAA